MSGYTGQGPYVGGFSLQETPMSEARTADTSTATLTFTGPWDNRWAFLNSVFGHWRVMKPFTAQQDIRRTATLTVSPVPYVYTTEDAGKTTVDTAALRLYPDSYTIGKFGDPALSVTTVGNPLNNPLLYYSGGCEATVTVNYRYKAHASWPYDYQQTTLCNWGDPWTNPGQNEPPIQALPTIPNGTFIEIAENENSIEYQSVNRGYSYDAPQVTDAYIGYDPEIRGGKRVPGSGSPGDVIQNPKVPEDIDNEVPIYRTRLVIRWSNLPFIPRSLKTMEGSVNQYQFLNFPPGSAFFAGATHTPKGIFHTPDAFVDPGTLREVTYHELYDVELEFLIKTVDFKCDWLEGLTSGSPGEDIDLALKFVQAYGIVCGRIAYWNRVWSETPMVFGSEDQGDLDDTTCTTNWVPVKHKTQSKGTQFDSSLLPVRDFSNIFVLE